MVINKHRSPVTVWRPRSFTGLMTLYESSYLKLMRLLAGAVPAPGAQLLSRVVNDLDLKISGEETSPYTTTLCMTYLFDDVADPDLIVRVYHDAHLVEAMRCGRQARHRVLRPFNTQRGSELERRWTRNLMLNKWLDYCHERGHRFGHAETPCVEPVQLGLR